MPAEGSLFKEQSFAGTLRSIPRMPFKQVSNMPRLQHGDLLGTVFGEWALSHLDDAVASAKRLDGFGKLAALRGILESRDDLSDAVRIEIGRQLGNERVAQNIVTQSNLSEAIKDPESAWASLIGDDLLDTAQTGNAHSSRRSLGRRGRHVCLGKD